MSKAELALNDQKSDSELIANSPVSIALVEALHTLLTQQGYPIDNVRLQGVIHQQQDLMTHKSIINILNQLGVAKLPESLPAPDAAFLPLLAFHSTQGWVLSLNKTRRDSGNLVSLDRRQPIQVMHLMSYYTFK